MQDQEAIREFLIESNENLSQLGRELLELEQRPEDAKLIASIFRTMHTVKGTAGFFGFGILGSITHVAENILSQVRDKQRPLTPELVSLILETGDVVSTILTHIEADSQEGEDVYGDLRQRLTDAYQAGVEGTAVAKPTGATVVKSTPHPTPSTPAVARGNETKGAPTAKPPAEASAKQLEEVSELNKHEAKVEAVSPAPAVAAPSPKAAVSAKPDEAAIPKTSSVNESSIRVDVGLLDKLMNLVGELVLARNQILQLDSRDATFATASQRLNLITTELQGSVMKTRLQPIGLVWDKLPRVVRDLSSSCGKKIQIEMDGAETELDKTIIEAIKDPLTHIVRNSCDHGIEMPEVRTKAGKAAQGKLSLRAYHEGGHVIIEIADDGAGMSVEKLKANALKKGLIRPEQAKEMSEREALSLIFMPGFSTAEKVTNISGRGVGMDVVKTNIEKIGGIVDIHSTAGQGSMVRMKIPLTLAIIPALIVTSASERYAIPQVSLLELVRLEGEEAQKGIEMIHGAPVYRLRGHLLPLVYLRRELKLDGESALQTASGSSGTMDFDAAREKHRRWVDTLRQVLSGKLSMSPEEAAGHDRCLLGKWIYSIALKQYGMLQEIHALEQAHKHFHEVVRSVLVHKAQGDMVEAERDLKELGKISNDVLGFLVEAEKHITELNNINIVVLQADERQFGLVVDEVNDTEEIVVKPVGKQLKSINMFAGATIMGDGRVALILDVLGFAQRANVVSEGRDRGTADADARQDANGGRGTERRSVLLLQHGENGRMAIDLGAVARLEEFEVSALEIAGTQETVQYRGEIMPLIRLSDVLQTKHKVAPTEERSLQVVVCAEKGRNIGLVVDGILDIVDEAFVLERKTGCIGVLGSAVIQKKITDIVDVAGVLAAAAAAAS